MLEPTKSMCKHDGHPLLWPPELQPQHNLQQEKENIGLEPDLTPPPETQITLSFVHVMAI